MMQTGPVVYRVRLDAAGPEKYLASWRRFRTGPNKGEWDLTYANTSTNTPRLWATYAAAHRAVVQFTLPTRTFVVEAAYVVPAVEVHAQRADLLSLLPDLEASA